MSSVLSEPPTAPMGASSPPDDGSPRRARRWVLGVAALLLVGALVAGAIWALVSFSGTGAGDVPVDESDAPRGMRGFVLLLESYGAQVERTGAPLGEQVDIALLHAMPGTTPGELSGLEEWVDDGGLLVVLGANPPWTQPAAPVEAFELARGPCDVEALADVETLRVDPFSTTLLDGSGGAACFGASDTTPEDLPVDQGAVVVWPQGDGAIVGIGAPVVFTNEFLAEADNAVLATTLFAPEPGARVAIVESSAGRLPSQPGGRGGPGVGGTGGEGGGGEAEESPSAAQEEAEEGLADLIPTGVRWGLGQLVVALVLWALWRARRLGRPLDEPQPVPLAGARLVEAVGTLLRRAGSPEDAAATLRQDLHRQLAARLGLPREADAELIAQRAEASTGVAATRVLYALRDRPVRDEGSLVSLAAEIDEVREEVLHGVPT